MHIVIAEDYADGVRRTDAYRRLVAAGPRVTVLTQALGSDEERFQHFADADILVLTRERTPIGAALLARLPRLIMISQFGKVASHIDVAACTAHGVAVAEGQGTARSTAELTWALILAAQRNLVGEVKRLAGGQWQGRGSLGQQLYGRRLGIWGYGRIGKQVAQFGTAFGMKVWVWGREGSRTRATEDGLPVAPDQRAFLTDSDVVSVHIRLNAQTRGLVTAADLALMRADALLVNTSRAELIAPGALLNALRQGRPGQAAVDVYEQEPVFNADDPLISLPNALCTPHLGYVERDNYEHYYGMAFDNILAFLAGVPVNIVNPDYLTRRLGKDFSDLP